MPEIPIQKVALLNNQQSPSDNKKTMQIPFRLMKSIIPLLFVALYPCNLQFSQ